jgi:hypothetical protein
VYVCVSLLAYVCVCHSERGGGIYLSLFACMLARACVCACTHARQTPSEPHPILIKLKGLIHAPCFLIYLTMSCQFIQSIVLNIKGELIL